MNMKRRSGVISMGRRLVTACAVVLMIAAGGVPAARADVTACVYEPPSAAGAENVMVGFDDICDEAPCELLISPHDPHTYRQVSYELLTPDAMSLVFGDSDYADVFEAPLPTGVPVVRNMTAPLLATICDTTTAACDSLKLKLEFDDPTPVFGFGYGFNDLEQPQNGLPTRSIGEVRLYNEYGRLIRRTKLRASRLYCCTEGRFDYAAPLAGKWHRWDDWWSVKTAIIEFTYDYVPFFPGVSPPMEYPLKFFGIDNVSYSIPEDASETCGQ